MATERSRAAQKSGKWDAGGDGIWSQIKQVFIDIQHNKCAYCERLLPTDPEVSLVEYDVEHFRPKGRVTPWPGPMDARAQVNLKSLLPLSNGPAGGYPHLAHSPFNYAIACKTCNSGLKGDAFPVERVGTGMHTTRARLDREERPLLLFPLGSSQRPEDQPEEVLRFEGVLPEPRQKNGYAHRRARVTIEFFRLDTRGELRRERALHISLFWAKRTGADPDPLKLTADDKPQAGCLRDFARLCADDPEQAKQRASVAEAYIQSFEPNLPVPWL